MATSTTSLDPIELGKWERGEVERSRALRVAFGLWYNIAPRLMGWTLTPGRLVLGSIRGLTFVSLTLWPIALKMRDEQGGMSWGEAVVISLILLGLQLFNFFYDKLVREYKSKSVADRLKDRLSLEMSAVTSGLNGLVKVKKQEHQPAIDKAREKLLECIRDASRIQLGDHEGTSVEVSLMLFGDADCRTMKVTNRTAQSRGTGVVRQSEGVMAYYVAKNRKHRVVHDFTKDPHPFPRKSLSGDKPAYRSILLIPLLDRTGGGPDTCVGVVTVDSSKPYHFWAGKGEGLVLQLKPYLSLLSFFLNLNEPHRLTCPPA